MTGVLPVFRHRHLVPAHPRTWGRHEVALPAPLSLLEHLVQTVTPAQVAASGDSGVTLTRRRAFAERDPETIAEALQALGRLDGHRPKRAWYVLEGASRPDATLEVPDAVLLIEGKRTERACTTKTKWMPARSQLVRQMDAASDFYPHKRILSLLVVEGDGGAEATAPSEHWQRECATQYSFETLARSLPHRSPEERLRLAQNILGVATWQALCAMTEVSWPPRRAARYFSFGFDSRFNSSNQFVTMT